MSSWSSGDGDGLRVLVVTQYFPPENTLISPTLAQGLSKRGHRVRVLTGYPNYPTGRLFEGYRQRWRTRHYEGEVEVLRVPLWTDHSQSMARRFLNYGSFALSAATARSYTRGADVVYVYATQMTPAFAPWVWRLTGGRVPYVLHVQDLWPDSVTGSSLVRKGVVARLVEALLNPWIRSLYRHAAAVIGIAPTMVETLTARGVEERKAFLVYNWALEDSHATEELQPASPRGVGDGVRITYAGNVGDMQDLETVVHAAVESGDAGVRLTIVGDGVALPRIRDLVRRLKADNVDFVGRVQRGEMGKIYRDTDFALVTLKDLPAFRGTVPSKFQASLSHGVPIITNVQGDVRRLVKSLEVGLTAETESVSSLAAAFRRAGNMTPEARASMAARARAAYLERFSQIAGVRSIERILADVSMRNRSGRRQRGRRSESGVID